MSFLDKLAKTATDAASRASNKAEELIEVNRLKGQQSDRQAELTEIKRKIGDYCYKVYEDGNIEDEVLINFCEQMQALKNEIADIDRQIEDTREGYRARQSEADEDRL